MRSVNSRASAHAARPHRETRAMCAWLAARSLGLGLQRRGRPHQIYTAEPIPGLL